MQRCAHQHHAGIDGGGDERERREFGNSHMPRPHLHRHELRQTGEHGEVHQQAVGEEGPGATGPQKFGDRGQQVCEELEQVLRADSSPAVRVAAIDVLAELRPRPIVALLIGLGDDAWIVRRVAQLALRHELTQEEIAVLVAFAQQAHGHALVGALRALESNRARYVPGAMNRMMGILPRSSASRFWGKLIKKGLAAPQEAPVDSLRLPT